MGLKNQNNLLLNTRPKPCGNRNIWREKPEAESAREDADESKDLGLFICRISNFVRWRDWGPGKMPVFFTLLAYIALSDRKFTGTFVLDSFLFIAFAALHSALGYVVNDWGDREIDKRHEKPNAFDHLSFSQGISALAMLGALAFLSGLPFVGRPPVLPLWIGWAFFAVAYSLSPLRLKERGMWGLAVAFVVQWTLPVLLTFAAMERFGGWDMIVFVIANTISGATLEIAHQRHDRTRDLSTGTRTFAVRVGSTKLDRLYAVMLLLDKAALFGVLITISFGISQFPGGIAWVLPGAPLLLIYFVLLPVALYENYRSPCRFHFLDPYYTAKRSASKLLHETVPNLATPCYLLLLATIFDPIFGVFLFAFVFWRLMLGRADWRWPLRIAKDWLRRRLFSRA